MTNDAGVSAVAFSPDGKYVIVGIGNPFDAIYDSIYRVWEAATGRELDWIAHVDRLAGVAFSLDSKLVVLRGCDEREDGECRVGFVGVWRQIQEKLPGFDLTMGKWICRFQSHNRYVLSIGDIAIPQCVEATTGNTIATMTHEDIVHRCLQPGCKIIRGQGPYCPCLGCHNGQGNLT
jgi:WD40 repeat protein